MIAINANPSGLFLTTIDDPYDIDRSGRVNAGDVIVANISPSGFSPLLLITPSASEPGSIIPLAITVRAEIDIDTNSNPSGTLTDDASSESDRGESNVDFWRLSGEMERQQTDWRIDGLAASMDATDESLWELLAISLLSSE